VVSFKATDIYYGIGALYHFSDPPATRMVLSGELT